MHTQMNTGSPAKDRIQLKADAHEMYGDECGTGGGSFRILYSKSSFIRQLIYLHISTEPITTRLWL
jgi:hypothetical protein